MRNRAIEAVRWKENIKFGMYENNCNGEKKSTLKADGAKAAAEATTAQTTDERSIEMTMDWQKNEFYLKRKPVILPGGGRPSREMIGRQTPTQHSGSPVPRDTGCDFKSRGSSPRRSLQDPHLLPRSSGQSPCQSVNHDEPGRPVQTGNQTPDSNSQAIYYSRTTVQVQL